MSPQAIDDLAAALRKLDTRTKGHLRIGQALSIAVGRAGTTIHYVQDTALVDAVNDLLSEVEMQQALAGVS